MFCATLNMGKWMTKETFASGGREGQDGGICVGSGSANPNEVSYYGKVYKKGDPDYEAMRKLAIQELKRKGAINIAY